MNAQSSDSPADVQSNLPPAKTLCLDLLLPMPAISKSCVEIGHDFRDRIYSPIMTTSEHQVADRFGKCLISLAELTQLPMPSAASELSREFRDALLQFGSSYST